MRTISEQTIDKLLILYIIEKVAESGFTTYGRLKFQKLSFLAEWNLMAQDLKGLHFKFLAYHQGPYSKDAALDVTFLVETGFLTGDYPYEVTTMGENLVSSFLSSSQLLKGSSRFFEGIDAVLKEWASHSGAELRDKVYKMRIAPHDFPSREMRIQDIPFCTDILVPEAFAGKGKFVLDEDLLEEFQYEFSLTPEDRSRMTRITGVEYEERFGDV